jgi:hypothetical protein
MAFPDNDITTTATLFTNGTVRYSSISRDPRTGYMVAYATPAKLAESSAISAAEWFAAIDALTNVQLMKRSYHESNAYNEATIPDSLGLANETVHACYFNVSATAPTHALGASVTDLTSEALGAGTVMSIEDGTGNRYYVYFASIKAVRPRFADELV